MRPEDSAAGNVPRYSDRWCELMLPVFIAEFMRGQGVAWAPTPVLDESVLGALERYVAAELTQQSAG